MTDKQIETLKKSVGGVDFYAKTMDDENQAALMYLHKLGYVTGDSTSPPIFYATQKGLAKLKQLEDDAHKDSEDKRQQRFENKISVLNVLVPLITFFVGILVEHFSGIADKILSFLSN